MPNTFVILGHITSHAFIFVSSPRRTNDKFSVHGDGTVWVGGMNDDLTFSGERVVLANPQRMFVDTLVPILQNSGMTVVQAATTRAGLLDAVRRPGCTLCLTSWSFADGSLAGATGEIERGLAPGGRIVVLSGDSDPGTLTAALEAGVDGFIHTSRGLEVLLSALGRLLTGETIIEASIVRDAPAPAAEELRVRRLAAYLTPRERECLAMVVGGLDTTAMSRRLGVSRTTIRSHVQAMLMKLDVHSRLEAAALAVQYGLASDLSATSRMAVAF